MVARQGKHLALPVFVMKIERGKGNKYGEGE